ncbi:Srb5p ASCRUDRAFT_38726 [Ascoidea rubescens DSM 1968]|uniref:Mediator of RNA polymerase II transcription subunit 18 n=1 Tax=Ascoidea rubescens DSM 1968 TaxID=1344418 RepID=A0A1D2VBB8_9ASCO|nr:hypothetical protein ASCRUDRAFT_38726 [Ascoidea rubescens DSM 1968]ODV58895.1 hypothetical protein ASCRUDRAFT_38726 [Ascoidea rubescens DSM 1968]
MVQQLSLYGTIPVDQFILVINTLIALTGINEPQILLNYNIILDPLINLKALQQTNKNNVNHNQIEQFLIKLSTDWDLKFKSVFKHTSSTIKQNDLNNQSTLLYKNNWNLQITDIPIASSKDVISQTFFETFVNQLSTDYLTNCNLINFFYEFGYMPKNEYWLKGLNSNIIIDIFQIYIYDFETKKLKLLDENNVENSWFMKSFININQISDIDLINSGNKDLLFLQKQLSDLIHLKVIERNLMDSRVKS